MQMLKKLWLGLLALGVVISALPFLVAPQGASPQPRMLVTLAASVVGLAALSFWLPARLLRSSFAALEVETREEPVPTDESAMFGGEPRMQKVFAYPDKAFRAALLRYRQPFLLGLAFGEFIALQGFVLAQQGFPVAVFLPFSIAGLVLVAVRYPNEKRILAAIEAATGARLPAGGRV